MLKQRVIRFMAALALVTALTGAAGITADSFGLSFTPQAFACKDGGSAGGGC